MINCQSIAKHLGQIATARPTRSQLISALNQACCNWLSKTSLEIFIRLTEFHARPSKLNKPIPTLCCFHAVSMPAVLRRQDRCQGNGVHPLQRRWLEGHGSDWQGKLCNLLGNNWRDRVTTAVTTHSVHLPRQREFMHVICHYLPWEPDKTWTCGVTEKICNNSIQCCCKML